MFFDVELVTLGNADSNPLRLKTDGNDDDFGNGGGFIPDKLFPLDFLRRIAGGFDNFVLFLSGVVGLTLIFGAEDDALFTVFFHSIYPYFATLIMSCFIIYIFYIIKNNYV